MTHSSSNRRAAVNNEPLFTAKHAGLNMNHQCVKCRQSFLTGNDLQTHLRDSCYPEEVRKNIAKLVQHIGDAQRARFRLHSEKCEIAKTQTNYLGREVKHGEIRPSSENISGLLKTQIPTTAAEACRFVKGAEYYRKFISHFSIIAEPLRKFVPTTQTQRRKQQKTQITLTKEELQSFEELKKILTSDLVLRLPSHRYPYKLQTDASDEGIEAVLLQIYPEGDRPVGYLSKKITKAQRKWSPTKQKSFALMCALDKWHNTTKSTQTDEEVRAVVGAVTRAQSKLQPAQQQPSSSPSSVGQDLSRIFSDDNRIVPFSLEDLKRAQRIDEAAQKIIFDIKEHKQYVLKDDLLFRATKPPVPFVPKGAIRSSILKICHDTAANGSHFGRDKTIHKINNVISGLLCMVFTKQQFEEAEYRLENTTLTKSKRRELRKQIKNYQYSLKFPAFRPSNYKIEFVNKKTTIRQLENYIMEVKNATILIDTESITKHGQMNEPALIQIQILHEGESSTTILIVEVKHLPPTNWNQCTLIKKLFDDYNYIHCESDCFCEQCIHQNPNDPWSLMDAIAGATGKWLDKSLTLSPFAIGLDARLYSQTSQQQAYRQQLSTYAAYDCLAIQSLLPILYPRPPSPAYSFISVDEEPTNDPATTNAIDFVPPSDNGIELTVNITSSPDEVLHQPSSPPPRLSSVVIPSQPSSSLHVQYQRPKLTAQQLKKLKNKAAAFKQHQRRFANQITIHNIDGRFSSWKIKQVLNHAAINFLAVSTPLSPLSTPLSFCMMASTNTNNSLRIVKAAGL
ncbi:unnamed protein product [Didymodactylos carnosus]|uniref:Reverse transcriptase/retrotransposon-derived protein RNase H-like domain-containing protein n=1 Tax=Didymodactylos carnosus TaxID=1234261 RepID=A0A815C423_9BILA|nr:unnamed protein product [Didymodactylos carnosus]CAF4078085.1 unnamed protein product [Didymodactylos carnosus]